jgi:hypothetical protein
LPDELPDGRIPAIDAGQWLLERAMDAELSEHLG